MTASQADNVRPSDDDTKAPAAPPRRPVLARAPGVRAVTVYCSSSSRVHPEYTSFAEHVGRAIGAVGCRLVYGGGKLGLMGAVAAGCRDAGGHVTGVIPERLRDAEQLDHDNHDIFLVRTMRERKQLLADRGDAFLVLPGGVGTLEEFFEVLVARLLGEHHKPIAMVNHVDPGDNAPYYTPLLDVFEQMINKRFMNRRVLQLFDTCATLDDVVTLLDRWSAPSAGSSDPAREPIVAETLDRRLPRRLTQ